MDTTTPLFLALTRPPKFFGLPMGYFIGLAVATAIPFIIASNPVYLLLFPICYGPLWFIADKNPIIFDMMAVVFSTTPRTRRHRVNGGDTYVS